MWSKISAWILKILGWRIQIDTYPLPPKYIIAVVPHTSNLDFPMGLLIRSALREDIKFIGKDSLFKFPLGVIFRWLGGYPVDRSKRSHFVDGVVDIFNKKDQFKVSIAPEGTRRKVNSLKTGFYYIAKGAHVPILLCKFDYGHKIIGISAPFFPTDDVDADFAFIDNYFRGVRGKNPQNGYLYSS